jgi:lactoylglutathione lyase
VPPKLVPELICSDIRRSRAFYCDVLGFSVVYERAEERFIYLEREGAEIMLEQPLRRGRLFPEAELVHPYGRGINFEITVRNVDAIHAAVLGANLTTALALEERWYDRATDSVGVRQFAVHDPDGYLLRFSTPLGTRTRNPET